ncbi:M24 family metallopeptidase [Chloroflexota bacterium]
MSKRLQKLRRQLAEREIDSILISQPKNRYYLSGFDGSSGFLFISAEDTVLATDFRYIDQAKAQAPDFKVFQIINGIDKWLPELTGEIKGDKLGFEADHISVATLRQMSDALKKLQSAPKLIPTEGLVESLRAVKEPEEIALITRAASLTDKAFAYITGIIKPGSTEREIAWEMEKYLRENGSQGLPFDIIVASGPNAALPHAKPSDKTIQNGEPVVLDFGARIGGYSSDLTRTIFLGKPDDTFRKIYDTVLGAQLAAMAIIKEGMTGDETDKLARTVINEAGYGEAFGHALGHGIGLATHEAPRLGPNSSDIITDGMVFSIEPGIYLPGWGGVRIEDLVLMQDGILKTISQARKVD